MTTPSIYKSPAGEQAVMSLYDSMLARWPVPHTETYVPTRHGSTFVIASGDASAPPLVLLHGAGTNSAMWVGDTAAYSRKYRVLALDLPGEPGRSAPNRPSWDGPAYSDWLVDALDVLGVGSATIIGVSQGAWAALKFAVANTRRVDAMVLLSPGGITPDKASFVLEALPLLLFGRWGIRRLNRMVLGGQPVPAELDEAMLTLMTHFKPRVGTLPIFSDAELRRLGMPVQLMMGGRDALRDPNKVATRMRALVPHLTVSIIPDAGHAIVDAWQRIVPFLESLPMHR